MFLDEKAIDLQHPLSVPPFIEHVQLMVRSEVSLVARKPETSGLSRKLGMESDLVYIAPPPLDAALLRIRDCPSWLVPVTWAESIPDPGATVYVVGYPLFGVGAGA